MTPDISSDELRVMDAIAEQDMTGAEFPGPIARMIASWWQSPGKVGHEMAVFASTGTITDPETWQADFLAIYERAKEGLDRSPKERAFDLRALDGLGTYVLNNIIRKCEVTGRGYAITVVTGTRLGNGDWASSTQSPTFYLDSNVQGIVSVEHAESIVRRWLTDAGLTVLKVTAVALESSPDPTVPRLASKQKEEKPMNGMNGMNAPDYGGRTVYWNAERATQSLIERAIRHNDLREPNPEWDVRAEVYAESVGRVERFMIAGNGPTEWVCFIFDDEGDLDHAYLYYSSAADKAVIMLGQFDGEDLYKQMKDYR